MRIWRAVVISVALLGGGPLKGAAREVRLLSRQDYPALGAATISIADFNGDGKNDILTGADGGFVQLFPGNGNGGLGEPIASPTPEFSAKNQRTADIDGDGKLDVVLVGLGSGYLVLLGNGDGSFRALPAQQFPNLVFGDPTLADFDEDGHVDMVIPADPMSHAGGAGIYFFRGRGDGTFEPRVHLGETGCNAAVALDFNRDGHADIAAACDHAVQIYRGNGDGTFQAHPGVSLSSTSRALAAGDLNGDGWPDLVVTSRSAGVVWALVNNRDGTFTTQTFSYGLGPWLFSIRIGDVNGDGKLDVLTTSGPGEIGVWFGNGDGSLQKPIAVASATTIQDFAIGSLRRRGALDLVTAAPACGCISVHLNSGTGKYGDNVTVDLGLNLRSMQKYDFNHDGRMDLLISSVEGLTLLTATGQAVAPFRIAWKQALPHGSSYTAIGDFNGDGLPDIATIDTNPQQELRIYLGDAGGGFTESYRVTPAVGSFSGRITTLDFNGDGKLDLAGAAIIVFPGRGDGTLASPVRKVPPGSQGPFVASADLNGDGLGDLLTGYIQFPPGASGLLSVLFKPGGILPPGFTPIPDSSSLGLRDGRLADLNHDGILDAVVVSSGLYALLGKPGGVFEMSYQRSHNDFPPVGAPPSVEVGDFNGDGNVDIAVASGENSLLLLLGDGAGSFRYDSSWGGGDFANQVVAGAFTDLHRPGYDELVTLNADGTLALLLNITNGSGGVDLP